MQVTGMLYGSKLLEFAGFPTAEVLGPDASEEEIKALIERHGSVFVKAGVQGRHRQEGQGRPARPRQGLEDRAEGKGAPVLCRAPGRHTSRKGERRDLRGRACRPSTRCISRSPTRHTSARRR